MQCDANVIGANSILFLIAIKLGAANAKLRDQVLDTRLDHGSRARGSCKINNKSRHARVIISNKNSSVRIYLTAT